MRITNGEDVCVAMFFGYQNCDKSICKFQLNISTFHLIDLVSGAAHVGGVVTENKKQK